MNYCVLTDILYCKSACTFAIIVPPIVNVRDPRMHCKYLIKLDLFLEWPEDDSKESKHVALK